MANPQEHALTYPLGDPLPAPGHATEVAPGIKWVRMGLPFALDHINLWLLRDTLDEGEGPREGWTLVDCGIANDATRAAWERVFAEELDGLPVLRVIVTHMHPDHIGLADWLTQRWGCRKWISTTDYNAARATVTATQGHGGESAAAFFAAHGLNDPEALDKVRERGSYYASMVPAVPAAYRRLMDGQTLTIGGRTWTCRAGYGHAPEHISLVCADPAVMISGDMVLPRISTNVSVIDLEPEADPLRLYLESLERLRDVKPATLVLPAHGKPFTGLHERLGQLAAHHDERLADVIAACAAAPTSAAELLRVLFRRPLDLHQSTFAMGEAVAHLHALWLRGTLRRTKDAQGVWRFSPA